MCVCLLAAATGSVVTAEPLVRAEEGKVEAIEIYRTSDNRLVNGGTVSPRSSDPPCRHPV